MPSIDHEAGRASRCRPRVKPDSASGSEQRPGHACSASTQRKCFATARLGIDFGEITTYRHVPGQQFRCQTKIARLTSPGRDEKYRQALPEPGFAARWRIYCQVLREPH